MAKKVLSFFLATMLIMSVLSVSAVIANPATIYTDGFETGSVADDGSYTSDVWNLTDAAAAAHVGWATPRNATLTIVEQGTAPNINKVLEVSRIETGGFHMAMSTANATIPADKAVYAGFKLMFTGYPSIAKKWLIGIGRNPLLNVAPGWVEYAITDTQGSWSDLKEVAETKQVVKYNTWVSVMMKITATTAQAWVYDAEGALLTTVAKTGSFKGYPSIFHPNEGGAANVKMYIDDSFYGLVDANNTIALQSSSLTDNATNVALTNQNIDLKFDMPVGDIATDDITCDGATVVAERIAYDTVRVNLSNVEAETTYTLDFSKVKGLSGNALAGKSTLTFTTMIKPANPATVYTDNFETGAVTDGVYTSNAWALNNAGATAGAGATTTPNVSMQIVTQNGNKVLEISRDKTGGGFDLAMNTGNSTIPADTTVYGIFKFMIPSGTQTGRTWYLGYGRTPLLKLYSGQAYVHTYDTPGSWHTPQQQNEVTLSYNTWNTAIIKLTGTTASAQILNAQGRVVQSSTEKTGSIKGIPTIFHPNDANNSSNLKLYLDDSRYVAVKTDNTMVVETSSIAADATNVELLDQEIDLTFDLPIADSAINGITLNGVAVSAIKTTYNSLRVTLPNVLAPSTAYTLSFANVTGTHGNRLYGAKTLNFTTKAYAEDFIVKNLGGLIVSNTDVPPGQQITVANVGAAKEDVDFIVAFYNDADTLIGAQWVTDVDFGAQATAQLQLANDGYVYRGVNGIRVFAFTADNELKPLFSGATYGNLWD